MKLLMIIMLISTLPVQAETHSSCQSACFASKKSCNARKSHTFNSCDDDLFACKASCESGKPQKAYGAVPLNISFHPIWPFD